MKLDFQSCPVIVFYSRAAPEIRLIAVGRRAQEVQGNNSPEFSKLCDTHLQCTNTEQLESVCKVTQSVVVVADATNCQDLEIAQAVAVRVTTAANRYAFLVNIGATSATKPKEFITQISMCNGFNQELLDALLCGLMQIQLEPGWIGIDINDIAAALESPVQSAFAAVGIASGKDQGKAAALAAVAEMESGDQSLNDATGAVVMMAINGVGLREVKTAMNVLREKMNPSAPIAYSCHESSGPPAGLRITLIASAKHG